MSSEASKSEGTQICIKLSDGRVFESNSGFTEKLSKGQSFTFNNPANNNEKITILWGRDTDISDNNAAARLEQSFMDAFSASKKGMDFMLGAPTDEMITIKLADVTLKALFNARELDISTQESMDMSESIIKGALYKLSAMEDIIAAYEARVDIAIDYMAHQQNLTEYA